MTTQSFRMAQRLGSHSSYVRGEDVVVEWYDFGDDAPYESANLLIFEPSSQSQLATDLELPPSTAPLQLASCLAERFASYFKVREFALERGLPFRAEVDFQP